MDRFAEAKLKASIQEIVQGYSVVNIGQYKRIHIKHFCFADSVNIDNKFLEFYALALKRGLYTAEQQLQVAIANKSWTETKEKRFTQLPEEITIQSQTRNKLFLKKEKDAITQKITSLENELGSLALERSEAVGYTAEVFATKKSHEYFVYYAFRQQNLTDFYFSFEEFDDFDETEMTQLVNGHNEYAVRFANSEIKRMAISSNFMNMIYVSGEEIYHFYGKPVVELTFRQLELFNLGLYYRQLLRDMKEKVTPEMLDNPDKLIQTVEAQKTTEEITKKIDNKEAAGVAVVGATQEELSQIGMQPGNISLSQEAAKKGGTLTMADLMKLHEA